MSQLSSGRGSLVPLNTKSLKKKEGAATFISLPGEGGMNIRQEIDMIETPSGDIKKKKKPFKPPVPKFEDPAGMRPTAGGESKNDEEKNNEIFSKFLEEINGGPMVTVAELLDVPSIEEEFIPVKKPQEEIKKLKPTLPRPDVNLDLISKLYKSQVGKEAPSVNPLNLNMIKPGQPGTILSSGLGGVGGSPASPGSQSIGPTATAASSKPPGAVGITALQGKPMGNLPVAASQKSLLKAKKEEYDPARPNEYEVIIADRLRKKKEEENMVKKRESSMDIEKLTGGEEKGVSSHKYLSAQEANQRRQKVKEMELEETPAEPPKDHESAQEEKILKMMEKTGWKFGGGLGKNEQGMTTPLIPVKTNSTTAIIMNSNIEMQSLLPQEIVMRKNLESQNVKSTKVLLLLNMVSRSDVDDHLRDEVTEECSKHGKVANCVIYMLNNAPDDQAIRIFVDFERKESAIKAYFALNGRYFAGRTVQARFYEESLFSERRYEL